MGQISLNLPIVGQPDSTEESKIPTAFTTIQTLVNGNLDSTNIVAALAQSATVNQASQVVKGVCVNAGPGTRTNIAYGALSDAADQVTSIVLPANGLIQVMYQATWQESVNGAAKAAIFVGANQVMGAAVGGGSPAVLETGTSATLAGRSELLATSNNQLSPQSNGSLVYGGDVSTPQVVGFAQSDNSGIPVSPVCLIRASAGTYTVSVQFKASSGTVTVSNRKLWVAALSFA